MAAARRVIRYPFRILVGETLHDPLDEYDCCIAVPHPSIQTERTTRWQFRTDSLPVPPVPALPRAPHQMLHVSHTILKAGSGQLSDGPFDSAQNAHAPQWSLGPYGHTAMDHATPSGWH